MNKENKPIEDLFKDAFEHFEKTPSNSVWSGIQAGINAPVTGAAVAAKSAMSIGAKIGIAVATVGVIATTLYIGFTNSDEDNRTITQQEVIMHQEKALIPAVEKESNSPEITNDEIENIEIQRSVSSNKNQANSLIDNSNNQVKASSNKNNQSTVKATANSTKKLVTPTNPIANTEGSVVISENKKITEQDEIAPNQVNEALQESKEEHAETASLKAEINVNKISGEVPFQLTFNALEEADSYTWKLNGLTISNSKSSSIEVTEDGTQKLELTVSKGKVSAQSTQIIDAKRSTSMTAIPNIFTPNQDGMNDVFRIEDNFEQLSVKVLDQNYKELHNWTGEYGFWDGSYPDGSMAPNGVYFYIATYKNNGKEETLKGSITLRR